MKRIEKRRGVLLDEASTEVIFETSDSSVELIEDGCILFKKKRATSEINCMGFWLNSSLNDFIFSFDVCFVTPPPENFYFRDRYRDTQHRVEGRHNIFTTIEKKLTKSYKVMDSITFSADRCSEEVECYIKNISIKSCDYEGSVFDLENVPKTFLKREYFKYVPYEFLALRTVYVTKTSYIFLNSNRECHLKSFCSGKDLCVRLNNEAESIIISFEIKVMKESDISLFIRNSGREIPIPKTQVGDFAPVTLEINGEECEQENFLHFSHNSETEFLIRRLATRQPKRNTRNYRDECTLLLQGVIKNDFVNFIDTIRKYSSLFQIVISTYESEDNSHILSEVRKNFPEIPIVLNSIQKNIETMRELKLGGVECNFPNIFHQIQTTREAIALVKTNFVIKTRTDAYFSDLDEFCYEMVSNPEKIVSSSLFVRGDRYCKFHPSDILFGGRSENVKSLIFSAYDNLYYLTETLGLGIQEEVLHRSYILEKAKQLNLDVSHSSEYIELMLKTYKFFCVNRHSNFNFRGNVSYNDLDKSSRDYIIWGCMM